MPSKYKTPDGNWEDFVIQTGMRDVETYTLLLDLEERVGELEEIAAGLVAYTGVSE